MWQGAESMVGWGGMFLGPLFMILIPVLFIYLIVVLVQKLSGGGSKAAPAPGPSKSSGIEILQERFARGEIDADEFEKRRAVLKESPQ